METKQKAAAAVFIVGGLAILNTPLTIALLGGIAISFIFGEQNGRGVGESISDDLRVSA